MQEGLQIKEPMIVARNGPAVILVSREQAASTPIDIFTDAQLYESKRDIFSPVLPFGSLTKFLYSLEVVDPPQPFEP